MCYSYNKLLFISFNCSLVISSEKLLYSISRSSPFSPNEIKYFMNLMQNDNTEGKGSTYAKLEVLLSNTKNAYEITNDRLKNIKGNLL